MRVPSSFNSDYSIHQSTQMCTQEIIELTSFKLNLHNILIREKEHDEQYVYVCLIYIRLLFYAPKKCIIFAIILYIPEIEA